MNRRQKKSERVFVSGNNAIQLEHKASKQYAQDVSLQKQIGSQKHEKINPFYTLVLVSVIVMTLAITIVLLKTQFVVADNAGRIIELQQELVEIKKKNDQIESDIHKNIDMNEVYRMATQELGMIQAGKNDVKHIQSEQSSYTVQYAEMEGQKVEEKANSENILAFISKGW